MGLTLCNAAVLVAVVRAVGSGVAVVAVIWVSIAAVVAGVAASTPNGVGVIEAILVLGLIVFGVDPAAAVVSTLVSRSLTCWLPMLPGWRSSRRLRAEGAL